MVDKKLWGVIKGSMLLRKFSGQRGVCGMCNTGEMLVLIKRWVWVVAILVMVVVGYWGIKKPGCMTIGSQENKIGSHGLIYWIGPTFKSFVHSDFPVCIPGGWKSMGEIAEGNGWAKFAKDKAGVMIKKDGFYTTKIRSRKGSNEITVYYPVETPRVNIEKYVDIVQDAFDRVENIYPKTEVSREIEVLVTAGLAGNTIDPTTRIYPDPNENLLFIVYAPQQYRADELVIHAVMHTYNRFRTEMTGYLEYQSPFGASEWSELEATWAETAFNGDAVRRLKRIEYLYNVHNAVRTNNYKLISMPPFNDKKAFEKINQAVTVKTGSQFLDYQYGHYILAPLSMIAVDGMLYSHKGKEDVESILTKIHGDPSVNFVTEISKVLTNKEVATFMKWVEGKETVPMELVFSTAHRYNTRQ